MEQLQLACASSHLPEPVVFADSLWSRCPCQTLQAGGMAPHVLYKIKAFRIGSQLDCIFLMYDAVHCQVRAKNEASFRCRDQDGWQPKREAIDAQEDIDSYRYTDLPLKAIAGVL